MDLDFARRIPGVLYGPTFLAAQGFVQQEGLLVVAISGLQVPTHLLD